MAEGFGVVIAVSAVIIFHLQTGALSGGYLGVDVFFVISGYRITDILREKTTSSTEIFSLRDFYVPSKVRTTYYIKF